MEGNGNYDGSVIIGMKGDNKDALYKLDEIDTRAKTVEKDLNRKKSLTFNVDVSDMEKGFQAANEKAKEIGRQVQELEEKVRSFSGDKNSDEFRGLTALLDQKKAEYLEAEKALNEAFHKAMGHPESGRVKWENMYGPRNTEKGTESAASDASEKVNELKRDLEAAKQALKDLEKGGKWFGDEEYDKAALKLQKLTEQVKEYKKELFTDENPFSLNNYAGKIREAENEMARLAREGKGLGDEDYDRAFQKLEMLRRELKEYKAELLKSAPAQDLTPQDPRLQELSEKAQNAVQQISELQQKLADLQEQNSKLGWALGARGERERLETEIDGVNGKILEMRSYLDSLAESGDLSQIAGGAGIAEQRISELSAELAALQEQQSRMGLALGAQAEYDALSEKIAEINRLLEVYNRELAAAPTGGLSDLAGEAEIARQDIVDLTRELAALKERQKELSASGLGLGFEEFDQNAARIAEITRQLKEYQKQLQQTGAGGDASEKPIDRASIAASKFQSILNKAGAVGHNAGKMIGDSFSRAGRVIGSAFKNTGKTFSSIAKKFVSLAREMNVLTKVSDAVGKKLSRLAGMIKRVFVFSVITKGLREVRTQLSAYLSLNAEFVTATDRIKGALLTAFQPIYEAVLPALTVFIGLLTRAIATVTQFVAVLFGTSAKQAQENAKKLYEQANALKATGEAAEEAAGSLAGFDEINQIQTENKSAGGGGAAEDLSAFFHHARQTAVLQR